jgi:RNA polymerase sigma-70 factor (ECF subfamily)
VQDGESIALATLYDRYSRLVFGLARRILRDTGEAEDLVHEFFMRVSKKAGTFDALKGSARTWMIQVAYRQVVNRRAYLMRRSFYTGTDLNEVENAISEETNTEDSIATHMTGTQLLGLLEDLNEKQRITLRLYFIDGYDLREIADKMGETFENTRHYYYRGLDRLRRSAIERGLAPRNQVD